MLFVQHYRRILVQKNSKFKMSINLLSKEQEKLIFHLEELEALLENYRDHKIAVVSIAGAFRTGKSFLISWLLKYIQ